jgi:hypothetical protein
MSTKALSTRRVFFGAASAALAAPIAATATTPEDLAARMAALEDANAILALQHAYVRLVNAGAHAEVAKLFADPSAAPLDTDVRRLSADRFGEHDVVDVSPAVGTATARTHCTVETETAIGPSCTLVEMARLQGDGVIRKAERRVLESTYVKQNGVWKIERAAYRFG